MQMHIDTEFSVGDTVLDTLTQTRARVVGISVGIGRVYEGGLLCNYHGVVIGYWLNSEYLNGGRHPWEVDHIAEEAQHDKTSTTATDSSGATQP